MQSKRTATIPNLLAALLAGLGAATAEAQVFYSVESPDGAYNWLLGTLHVEDPRVLDFPPVLEQALIQAETVALELVPDAELLETLDRRMLLPDGQRLSSRLPTSLYPRVVEALRRHGLEPARIERLRPWAAAMTLSRPPAESGRFMDLVVARRALAGGAEAVALESLEEQLVFFTGLDEHAHVALLQAAVERIEHADETLEALVRAHSNGDLDAIAELAERQLAGLPEPVRRRFWRDGIATRNRAMAERAVPLLAQGRTLIAVGALHLPGEEGLIALLREQGNRVEAIY